MNKKNTDKPWLFQPGESGNPHGRPKAPEIEQLRKAMEAAVKVKNLTLLEHMVLRAYESDVVLVAVAKKILPDLRHVEGDLGERTVQTLEQLIAEIHRKRVQQGDK